VRYNRGREAFARAPGVSLRYSSDPTFNITDISVLKCMFKLVSVSNANEFLSELFNVFAVGGLCEVAKPRARIESDSVSYFK
jgi:hypothetical protein